MDKSEVIQQTKPCSKLVWRPIMTVVVLVFVVMIIHAWLSMRSTTQSPGHAEFDVSKGGTANIDSKSIREEFQDVFQTVPPRPYGLKRRHYVTLRARANVPFVVVIPGVPQECDFEGTYVSIQDADVVVIREDDVLERVRPPGKCNQKKIYEMVCSRAGRLKWTVYYHHRHGQTDYVFDLLVVR